MTASEKIIKALENGSNVRIDIHKTMITANRGTASASISGVSGLHEIGVRGMNGFDWARFAELGLVKRSERRENNGKRIVTTYSNYEF